MINDRVFNTLYGLAYKLRAVHRSSWQRINGRGVDHGDDLSLLPLSSLSSSVSDLSADRLGSRVIVLRFPSFAVHPLTPLLSLSYSVASSLLPRAFSRFNRVAHHREKLVNPTIKNGASLRREMPVEIALVED